MRVAFSALQILPVSRTLEFSYRSVIAALVLVVAALPISGCAIKLAPDFDKAIFDGLSKTNENAMKLFASATSGSFEKRAKIYDDVIGELNAVQVQINARAVPPTPPLLAGVIGTVGDDATEKKLAELAKPPTSADVDNLILIMEATKLADQKGRLLKKSRGLQKTRLEILKNSFSIQMTLALTYEKALQR